MCLRFFVNKNGRQRDTEWGSRILEGKLLTIFSEQVLPKVTQEDQDHLHPLVMAFTYLISEIIDNEIHLIRALLKPG